MKRIGYDWCFDDYPKEKNGLKVFSTFSCGGGSTMGYKLAGYDVLGCCEIDPKIIEVYKKNHKPRYAFNDDIRDFLKRDDLPDELYELDILDGSPPCSTFSMSGSREAAWGKQKRFAEGQKLQRLDDLFFEFIRLADKLRPKVCVSENVKGIVIGNAKGYVKQIVEGFDRIGYETQIFLLNGATMGLPQARERCFFVSRRKDLNFPKLRLCFNEKPIPFKEIKDDNPDVKPPTILTRNLMRYAVFGKDKGLNDIAKRVLGKDSYFNSCLIYDNDVMSTITAKSPEKMIYFENLKSYRRISKNERRKASSFPRDYDFGKADKNFIMGMSVPPIMMYKLSEQIYLQLFKNAN